MTQWNCDGIQLLLQSLVLADRERQWILQPAVSDNNWGAWHHCIFFIVAATSLLLADRERQWTLQLAVSDDNWGMWHHCIFS